MDRVYKLPSAFRRFRKVGGVVDFTVFEDADGTGDEVIDAIGQVLRSDGKFDEAILRELGGRPLFKNEFLGDWYDPATRGLIKRGEWQSDAGVLRDPLLKSLDRVRVGGGATIVPFLPGSGGQLAYAFSNPPYGLGAKSSELQHLFDEICDFVMPRRIHHDIRDWSSPRLPEVSPAFRAGMEWWGVFLFSIHVPALRRLTIAMASTTD